MTFSRLDIEAIREEIDVLCAPPCARAGCSHPMAVHTHHKVWKRHCGTTGCQCDRYQEPARRRSWRLRLRR